MGTVRQPTPADPGWVVGATAGELYTDNLQLAASGASKQTSWITQLEPFFRAAASTSRFSGLIDYRLTGYVYAGRPSDNQVSQNLNAEGTLTVVPQHLFLESTALYGSEVINQQQSSAPGAFFLSGNRANVGRGTVSPYWIQGLGNAGTMSLRYSYGRVVYNTRGVSGRGAGALAGIPDVTSHAVQFGLVSPKGRTWGWNLHYSDQHIRPDFGSAVDFAVAKAASHLQISTATRLLVDAGRESNFRADGTVDKLGASFWDAGFSWANGVTRLKMMIGHRFYGRSYTFSWERQAALLTTSIRYEERPTDINQQLLGQNPEQLVGAPVATPGLPSITQRHPYLMKRATASVAYQMPRGSLRVTVYDERRRYFGVIGGREKVDNANVDWRFDIGALTTLTPTLAWQRYRFLDGEVRHTTYEQIVLAHQFGPRSTVSARLRHDVSTVSSATPGTHGYGVNVVFVQWTHLF